MYFFITFVSVTNALAFTAGMITIDKIDYSWPLSFTTQLLLTTKQ